MSHIRIVFMGGTEEIVQSDVDYMKTDPDGVWLRGFARRTYGLDEPLCSYVIANLKKWEKID